jgi:hypothetical protein
LISSSSNKYFFFNYSYRGIATVKRAAPTAMITNGVAGVSYVMKKVNFWLPRA